VNATTPIIRLQQAGRRFDTHQALRPVDLTVHPGERVAILGASGAGKSTLLTLLNGSAAASEGQVEIFGQRVGDLSAARLRSLQRRIGMITQRLDLIEQVRVLHNVNAGRLGHWSTARGLASLLWPRPDDTLLAALRDVGMEWAVHERTERLSGGERQRVAIARLVVQQPELILADEPVSSLDPVRAGRMLDLLRAAGRGVAVLVSLHQPALAKQHCTRAIGLRDGLMVFDVPVEHLTDALLSDLYTVA
jgi:phosphonate transport system ATP-binding protein